MSFQSKAGSGKTEISYFLHNLRKKLKERNKTLQTQKRLLTRQLDSFPKERASAFAAAFGKWDRRLGGSFTVEAALVMTIFLLSVCGILYLFLVFHLQITLQEAGETAVQKGAQYGYIQENLTDGGAAEEDWLQKGGMLLQHGLGLAWLRAEVIAEAGQDYLEHSCIQGGGNGIQMAESRVMDDGETVDLVMRYQVEIPAGFPGMTKLVFIQRCRRRAWVGRCKDEAGNGAGAGEDGKGQVYVTETGTVYHLYRDCTHLRLSLRQAEAEQIESLRNQDGGRYRPCEKCCANGTKTQILYITEEGDRYHSTLGCSGLKRTVSAVSMKETSGMALCSRCRQRKERQ